jgi:uroporphyrinogen-III synthase
LPDAILIARPEPGAGETAQCVAAMGLTPLVAPALTIEAMQARLPSASAVAAVLVTSGNALAACLPMFRDPAVFAVGDATAARARELGFERVASASGDAAALADLVIRTIQPGDRPLLLVAGQGQGAVLAATMRSAEFRVVRRVVYRSCPAIALPDAATTALRAGEVRAALFFSAETARVFIRLIRQEGLRETVRGVDAFAIGAAAGVALQALPWRRIGVAVKPTQDAMLALLR